MRFGCCGSMISPSADPIGMEVIETTAQLGFDYIELPLSPLAALPAPDFTNLVRRLERAGIRCEACNNFFPPSIRLTGGQARLPVAVAYAEKALERAARLGASILVFGSSGAKNVPEGFPMDTAWHQLVELLQALGPVAKRNGITIAIEPLNRQESNIVNRAAEGLKLVREVRDPSVQLMMDFYHLTVEKEDPEIILDAGAAVRHVHFAEANGRIFPRKPEDAYVRFFSRLKEIRYQARCSIEAHTRDYRTDATRALRLLKGITAEGQTPWN